MIPDPFEIDGFKFYRYPDHSSVLEMALGRYEVGTTYLVRSLLRPGDTFVDIGANIGWFVLHAAAAVRPHGCVYAFEPDPSNAMVLEKNIEANGYEALTSVVRKAVGCASAVTLLHRSKDGQANSLYETLWMAGEPIPVEVVSLDEFFGPKGYPSVNLVKMDIEGAEAEALRGMREVRQRNPGMKLIVEISPVHINAARRSLEGLHQLLKEVNFSHFSLISERSEEIRPLDLPDDIPYLERLCRIRGNPQNLLCETNQKAL
jgi:FkbM family methyltransferase